jgi:hypothetical protein
MISSTAVISDRDKGRLKAYLIVVGNVWTRNETITGCSLSLAKPEKHHRVNTTSQNEWGERGQGDIVQVQIWN